MRVMRFTAKMVDFPSVKMGAVDMFLYALLLL